jgi:hypothetical protein
VNRVAPLSEGVPEWLNRSGNDVQFSSRINNGTLEWASPKSLVIAGNDSWIFIVMKASGPILGRPTPPSLPRTSARQRLLRECRQPSFHRMVLTRGRGRDTIVESSCKAAVCLTQSGTRIFLLALLWKEAVGGPGFEAAVCWPLAKPISCGAVVRYCFAAPSTGPLISASRRVPPRFARPLLRPYTCARYVQATGLIHP